jgi:hypothetical protein
MVLTRIVIIDSELRRNHGLILLPDGSGSLQSPLDSDSDSGDSAAGLII